MLFSKDKHYYKGLREIFGIYPNNIEIYKLALVHKSASIVLDDGSHINNERLEYLGDAVIEAVVSDMLYIEYPEKNEGFLTQMRSKIVSRSSLNELAMRLGIDRYVVAQGNFTSSFKNIHGDAFEALIGAIYLDKGYNFANSLLIDKIFRTYINLDSLIETESDYKSRLIEWGQHKRKKIQISCRNADKSSRNDPDQFYAIVSIGEDNIGYGIGSSKKEAEQRACKNALDSVL